MITEHPFASTFEFEVLSELPIGNERRLFYPGACEAGGRDGLNIRVMPLNRQAWIGTFAFGKFGTECLTRVVSAPNPSKLCVIADGQAYLVDAYDPENCETVSFVPVLDMRTSAKHELLILANRTRILAIGRQGTAWTIDAEFWDQVKLMTMTEDTLSGMFWEDRTGGYEQKFAIDLATGSLILLSETG